MAADPTAAAPRRAPTISTARVARRWLPGAPERAAKTLRGDATEVPVQDARDREQFTRDTVVHPYRSSPLGRPSGGCKRHAGLTHRGVGGASSGRHPGPDDAVIPRQATSTTTAGDTARHKSANSDHMINGACQSGTPSTATSTTAAGWSDVCRHTSGSGEASSSARRRSRKRRSGSVWVSSRARR
jgi:hypothetical protein